MSASADLVVRARRFISSTGETAAAVLVRDGTVVGIAAYDAVLDAGTDLVLADDEVLLPGLVDTHVHVNEPGRTHWEGYPSATRAAAAGGVTTLVDMPLNSLPPTLDVAALETKRASAAGRTWIDVAFWGGATEENLEDLDGLFAAGVLGVKGFLCDSGVPEFGSLTDDALRDAAKRVAANDGLLLVHAETSGPTGWEGGRDYRGFLDSRPAAMEASAISRVVLTARETGCRAHIVHVSSAEAVALLRTAQAAGVPISGETCPHYLTLDPGSIPDGATEFKCCPPVRGSEHQDALWAGLADGTLCAVVSDHSPSPAELKARDSGDFGAAWGGISSLQLGLPVMWTAAQRRGVPLSELVRWMATGPAALVGATTKGSLAVGKDADFSVFAPDDEFTVDGSALEHRHPLTPYDGARLRGRVRQTWLRGRPIDLNGEPTGRLRTRGDL